MNKNKFILLLILVMFVFSSCLKKRALKEVEDQKILNFIFETGLEFDTTKSGAIYHVSFAGEGETYNHGDIIPIICTGFYYNSSNQAITFANNDTFDILIGDREIMDGWNDLIPELSEGASGIIIFPHNTAYGNEQVPNVAPNSTLFYYFRLATDNYRISQTALFWNYTEKYDSILTILPNYLCYAKYFDGTGDLNNSNLIRVDFYMSDLNDSIYVISDDYIIDKSNENLTVGLKEGVSYMREGEMGKIIVPPNLAYTEENIYDITPYTSMVYQVRIKSENPDIEEKSNIDQYLYFNNKTPDSILPNNIYYFIDNQSTIADGINAFSGAVVWYSDSLYIINKLIPVQSCQNCNSILNSSNFEASKLNCILTMKEGEEATFIIPYSQGYGSEGTDEIPPYSTLLYKVKLDSLR